MIPQKMSQFPDFLGVFQVRPNLDPCLELLLHWFLRSNSDHSTNSLHFSPLIADFNQKNSNTKYRRELTVWKNYLSKWEREYLKNILYTNALFRFSFDLKTGTFPVDTGRKLNVHKTSRTSSERLMQVQFTSYVERVVIQT